MSKTEEILLEHFPPKGNACLRGRIVEYGNDLLEWAALEASNLECGDPTPRCTIAARIRAGKSQP